MALFFARRDREGRSSESVNPRREALLRAVQKLLTDCFRMRDQGVTYARLAHAQGYADGFVRALIDSGVVSHEEVLALVAETRRSIDGPALGSFRAEPRESTEVPAGASPAVAL